MTTFKNTKASFLTQRNLNKFSKYKMICIIIIDSNKAMRTNKSCVINQRKSTKLPTKRKQDFSWTQSRKPTNYMLHPSEEKKIITVTSNTYFKKGF